MQVLLPSDIDLWYLSDQTEVMVWLCTTYNRAESSKRDI